MAYDPAPTQTVRRDTEGAPLPPQTAGPNPTPGPEPIYDPTNPNWGGTGVPQGDPRGGGTPAATTNTPGSGGVGSGIPDAGGLRQGPNAGFITSIFKEQGKTPSQTDLDYWENVITRANGDMGYVRMRMLQPDTGGTGGGGGGAGSPMNYQQALAYVQGKVGRSLTPAEIQQAFTQFGGNQSSTFTEAGLAPVVSMFGTRTAQSDDPNGPGYTGPAGYRGYGPAGGAGGSQGNPGGYGSGSLGTSGGSAQQQLYDLLMQRATQSLNINPLTDSIIAPQVNDARAQQERVGRDFINDTAESGNPYSTGGLQNTRTQTGERVGQNVSALQSQLTQNELTARRGEIQQALSGATGFLTQQQQLALQQQLGLIDAALKQQSIGNQNSQFYAGLDQNGQQFMRDLLFRYAGLDSQNGQFAANYNLNSTNLANYWDAIRRGLL